MAKTPSILLGLLLGIAAAHGAPSLESRLQHLPPPVRQTVRDQLGKDGKLGKIKRSTEDSHTVFEVTIRKGGKDRDFTIARNGSVLEKEVFLEELPQPVQRVILENAHGVALDDITQTMDDGETNYDVDLTNNDHGFTVSPTGKLISVEMSLGETPPAVQKAIQDLGGTVSDISKGSEEGAVTYDVEITKDGAEQDVTFTTDGKRSD